MNYKKLSLIFSLVITSFCVSGCGCNHHIVIDEAVAATCTQPGLTEGSHCDKCNEVIVKQEVVPAIGHTLSDWEVLEEPTCEHEGLKVKKCSICQEIVESESIHSIEHELSEWIVVNDPTCDADGLKVKKCLHCDKIFESEVIPAVGHKASELVSLITTPIENIDNPGLFKCDACKETFVKTVTPEDVRLPVLSITGDFTGMSKDVKKKLHAVYEDKSGIKFDSDCTLKWQGGSSISYPKKNYNMILYKNGTDYGKKDKVKLVDSWGKASKYTLKANWVDYSQSRNVVSGKLYGQVVHSREIQDEFAGLVNGGAIDGYPILIYQNGVYQGLYTINIPKDDWLFGMDGDEETREAIVMGDTWTSGVSLYEPMAADFSNGWSLEYSSTEDSEIGNTWISESFNNMINFLNNNDGEDLKNGISTFVNVDRVIDSMLFTWLIHACDNVSKNILWVTYDGVKWQPSVYDMDGVFGLVWDGSFYDTSAWVPYTGNLLWNKIYNNYLTEIKERYLELRSGIMSIENITKEFTDFDNGIPSFVRSAEKEKWTGVPSQTTNNLDQIISWTKAYYSNMDNILLPK